MQRQGGRYVAVTSDAFQINLEIFAEDLPPSTSNDFALWLTLPIAMREGRALVIDGPVSGEALHNAQHLAEVWAFWLPTLFEPVPIRASLVAPPAPCSVGAPRLMCFSGGMDSTFALVRHVETTGEKPALLTIQGMDYQPGDDDRFARLMDKTADTRATYGQRTVNIRSNAASVMRRFDINPDIGFAFNAFACLFLVQNHFSGGMIAADNPLHIEFLRMPYGSNSLSNAMFDNGVFQVETLGLDAARSEKAEFLASRPVPLTSLSFCKDYGIRPQNCGLCSEFIRAKALFYAATGAVPEIFLVNGFRMEVLAALEADKLNFHVVGVDILASARKHGRSEEFEPLRAMIMHRPKKKRLKRLLMKLKAARQARKARAARLADK